MRDLARPRFWGLLVVGWLVAIVTFGWLVRAVGVFDEMSHAQLWVTGVGLNVLALSAAFAFARVRSGRH